MPRLRHLLMRPRVRSVTPGLEGGVIEVVVEGLACRSLCVRRTEEALRSLPGVTAVEFREGPDRFRMRAREPLRADEIAGAVDAKVVAPWARRLLAALAERLGLIRA